MLQHFHFLLHAGAVFRRKTFPLLGRHRFGQLVLPMASGLIKVGAGAWILLLLL